MIRVIIMKRQEANKTVSNAFLAASKLRKNSLLYLMKTRMTASISKQT
jgi:hypothetical protein